MVALPLGWAHPDVVLSNARSETLAQVSALEVAMMSRARGRVEHRAHGRSLFGLPVHLGRRFVESDR
jgi:hypothetical protein